MSRRFFSCVLLVLCISASAQTVTVPPGTPVLLHLDEPLDSTTVKPGQPISFTVDEDVPVQGRIILRKGDHASATIADAATHRSVAKGGALSITFTSVTAGNGAVLPLMASAKTYSGTNQQFDAGVLALSVLSGQWITAPIAFLPDPTGRGFEILIPQGTLLWAVTGKSANPVSFTATDLPIAPPPPPRPPKTRYHGDPTATATITAGEPDTKLVIDGKRRGDAPLTCDLIEGTHHIYLSKDGFTPWIRKVTIAGEEIQVHAMLLPAPQPPATQKP